MRQLPQCADDAPRDEELGNAVFARIMIDRNFGKHISRIFDLLDHLKADRPADALQLDLIEDSTGNQTEVAIYVSNAYAKE